MLVHPEIAKFINLEIATKDADAYHGICPGCSDPLEQNEIGNYVSLYCPNHWLKCKVNISVRNNTKKFDTINIIHGNVHVNSQFTVIEVDYHGKSTKVNIQNTKLNFPFFQFNWFDPESIVQKVKIWLTFA